MALLPGRGCAPGLGGEAGEQQGGAMSVEFESVIADGVIYPAFTDDDGVLWIDDEEDFEVVVDHAVVDGVIYRADVDEDGRLLIYLDD
ncbi:hypothetical protein AB0O64_32495 [Streptomyces sp. NPDC088341]|uniref:hypothetical protein n=1 Tax=Streptomyces sp. NPDC088341 TaxID=3154870 RepID=UPI00343581C6